MDPDPNDTSTECVSDATAVTNPDTTPAATAEPEPSATPAPTPATAEPAGPAPTGIRGALDLAVLVPALVLVAGVLIWGLTARGSFAGFVAVAAPWTLDTFGWVYVLAGTGFVVFALWLALSRYGEIRLGRDDQRPEFSTPSWIAMMFGAGMGIGLMFYGVNEPLTHYRTGTPGHETNEVGTSMATTMFHWTLHPWAVYAVVGLGIAYGTFRMGRRQLISQAFVPLIGQRRADGPIGKTIDVLAIFATVFGTATSLGLGAIQIARGLVHTGAIEKESQNLTVGVIVVLGIAFLVSALSGVARGIQLLSNTNMVVAFALLLFVIAAGPTIVILNLVPTSLGAYADQFFQMAGRTSISSDGTAGEWLSGWTVFYWAWWISWSPFVGLFLARISRGRTIREFVIGVLVVPSAISVIWFATFGGAAINREQNGDGLASADAESQLFELLDTLPWTGVVSVLVMLLIAIFFITGADSASIVMGSISGHGRVEPTGWVVAMWGVLTGSIAVLMLTVGGEDALKSLQSLTVLAASPFVIVLILLCLAMFRAVSTDPMFRDEKEMRRIARMATRERMLTERRRKREAQQAAAAARPSRRKKPTRP